MPLFHEDGDMMDIFLEAPDRALLQFAQAISKVCNMRHFKREVLASLFEEMLAEFVQTQLGGFAPKASVLPIPDRDDLESIGNCGRTAFRCICSQSKMSNRARLATISCFGFQRHALKFQEHRPARRR